LTHLLPFHVKTSVFAAPVIVVSVNAANVVEPPPDIVVKLKVPLPLVIRASPAVPSVIGNVYVKLVPTVPAFNTI